MVREETLKKIRDEFVPQRVLITEQGEELYCLNSGNLWDFKAQKYIVRTDKVNDMFIKYYYRNLSMYAEHKQEEYENLIKRLNTK